MYKLLSKTTNKKYKFMQPKSIYVMGSDVTPVIKVGVSKSPEQRLTGLITKSGLPLKILYRTDIISNCLRIENMVKEKFKDNNISGEWFIVEPKKIINYIESLINEFDVTEEINPRHTYIKPNYIKEVDNLPQLDEVICDGFVGVAHFKDIYKGKYVIYFIKYSHKKYDIIIQTEYRDIAKFYAKKLKEFTHNLTKYVRDEQNR